MKIVLNKTDELEDWYTIVRAEHGGIDWIEEVSPDHSRYMCSERLSPEACIEGYADHMLAVAHAIKDKTGASFKRVAVCYSPEENGFYFWSPKNSKVRVLIPTEDADNLANEILGTVKQ